MCYLRGAAARKTENRKQKTGRQRTQAVVLMNITVIEIAGHAVIRTQSMDRGPGLSKRNCTKSARKCPSKAIGSCINDAGVIDVQH